MTTLTMTLVTDDTVGDDFHFFAEVSQIEGVRTVTIEGIDQ